MYFFRSLMRLLRLRWVSIIFSGLAIIFILISLYISQVSLIRQFDFKVYDTLLPLAKREALTAVPVVIDIDEASLDAYGQWPWPRYLVSNLLIKLKEQGVSAIALDILFSEPDRSSPTSIKKYLKEHENLNLNLQGFPQAMLDYDQMLAKTLKDTPSVLGAYAHFEKTKPSEALDMPGSVNLIIKGSQGAKEFESSVLNISSATLPLESFWNNAPIGFINVSPDSDGIVRRVPLLFKWNDEVYSSLSLRVLMLALGAKKLTVNMNPEGIESVRVGAYTIPLSPEGEFLLPFQGPHKTYTYISAKDVLQDKVDPTILKGAVAFVGTSAPGLLDIRATPFDTFYPGIEIHATLLDAVLAQKFIQDIPWVHVVQVLIIFISGIISIFIFGFARPYVYMLVGLFMAGSIVFISRYYFIQGYYLSPLYGLITIGSQGVFILFLRFWQAERQKAFLYNTFSRYVSPEIVKRITKLQGNIFAGEERNVTIMFTDIRRFTAMSESLKPEQVVNLLNRYFTPMTALVRENSGTLDKFIGDSLMCFWNAPVPVPYHAVKAVETAIKLHENLEKLNVELATDFGLTMSMGVGVHTGKVYVGNMGSADLLNYTIIGDNVNLASRIEGLCAIYQAGIVISSITKEECESHFGFQFLDVLRVKGKQQPIAVYIPMTLEEAKKREEELKTWDTAIDSYQKGNFEDALIDFEALREKFPTTYIYELYVERTKKLLANPPENWDGVWVLSIK
ncbi:CHASE2 domain-containing protein [Desulfovibrio litoralis]|uniref:Adenylate cyclase n=1 Tax=Desulfovibrio litoralis DSM 11393 TaxID=1121455 RepID=A0A1M7SFS7_9BACT|nr:adenylate/guanylate cyclase domain-containing protein [Desulfovibrio litoralis]SHN57337.1 adenylate cyclase [Desulfovibrio litoralis DSM 11393]